MTDREVVEKVLALLAEGHQGFRALLRDLGRPYVFSAPDDDLPAGDRSRWLVFVDLVAMPINAHVASLLLRYEGVFVGPYGRPIPQVREFLLHQSEWTAAHLAWKARGEPYPLRAERPFPAGLEDALVRLLESMEAEQEVIV